MQGTESKQVFNLYMAIMRYFEDMSGIEVTELQVRQCDWFLSKGGIVCDASLDSQVIALQDAWALADDYAAKKLIVKQAIDLLYTES